MSNHQEQLDLNQLEAVVRGYESRGAADADTVPTLIDAANTLSSRDLGDYARQTALLHRAAALALTSPRQLPIEHELQLLAHLQAELPGAGADERDTWTEKRRDRAGRWINALGRLDGAIDPGFDFDDTPALNLPAPSGFPSGIAPEHIEDPDLRRRYEEDLERNRQKAERYAQQWRARQLRDAYEPTAIRYLTSAYGPSHGDWRELGDLLDEHGVTGSRKTAILQSARGEGQQSHS